MSYAMSRAEREQFLAQPHVGVLSVLEDGAPLTIPIWYGYLAGGPVSVITGRDSRKARAVQTAGWLSLCAQDEAWPYKYVTASGPASVVGPAGHADQRAMAARYLGDQGADEYMAWVTASGEADEQIVIEMTPQTWLTVDYGKPG
ncbi:MAG TPA: pyridoxamine 5'-phosphate oxidase family protein [Streptosporangiaceae bacterium]|jgi:nitroimidazol reductase NimA-like FMN-containing flavoprotein (pyridoxamine 5'-phosphate oxidase superfamily)|nr:pyridoxamine 5'-phosphate oxidase family protein [Streptosporangiaceae bacterium]